MSAFGEMGPTGGLDQWIKQCPLVKALRDDLSRGDGVRVALVDTAVSVHQLISRHPGAKMVGRAARLQAVANQGMNHGTLMADVLLRLAPGSLIDSHDVFHGRPTTEPEAILAALSQIRVDGLCKVINLSLGIPEERWDSPKGQMARQMLGREILACYRAGIVVVASAHNAHPALQSAPADNPPPLISVAKGDFDDPFRVDYHPGDTAEFRAKATGYWGILGTTPSSSTATAHATGLICRILGLAPHLGPFEVKALLKWYSTNQITVPASTL